MTRESKKRSLFNGSAIMEWVGGNGRAIKDKRTFFPQPKFWLQLSSSGEGASYGLNGTAIKNMRLSLCSLIIWKFDETL